MTGFKRFINEFGKYYNLVKFPHTLFALPFALTAFTIAIKITGSHFTWLFLLQILGAMVFARNTAMGFNRYIDRFIDAKNPRTMGREIPSGKLRAGNVLFFSIINAILFAAVAYSINTLCFLLSFPALTVLIGYSYTKRITWLCHYVLGLSLAIAPAGAYIAVTGRADMAVILLFCAVFLWSSGFDIIYSLSDEKFDTEQRLNSMPQRFGVKKALYISVAGHLIVVPILIAFGISYGGGFLYYIGLVLFFTMLLYQHLIVKPGDLSRVNAAFFGANGIASVVFAIFTISDILL
jgi:4-hydroxybenzoate polyprenyltransferase